MIWQTNENLNKQINDWGCYWMALIWHASRIHRMVLDAERLLHMYDRHSQMGWMTRNCFILNPTAILRDMGVKSMMTTDDTLTEPWKLPASYICSPQEFEVLEWRYEEGHFTAGDGKGNLTYDPMGISRTASNGKVVSKRVFRRIP